MIEQRSSDCTDRGTEADRSHTGFFRRPHRTQPDTNRDNPKLSPGGLFKAWFVDFDPVRAQAAGEKPAGLADDLAALFPDRLRGSELGEYSRRGGVA